MENRNRSKWQTIICKTVLIKLMIDETLTSHCLIFLVSNVKLFIFRQLQISTLCKSIHFFLNSFQTVTFTSCIYTYESLKRPIKTKTSINTIRIYWGISGRPDLQTYGYGCNIKGMTREIWKAFLSFFFFFLFF